MTNLYTDDSNVDDRIKHFIGRKLQQYPVLSHSSGAVELDDNEVSPLHELLADKLLSLSPKVLLDRLETLAIPYSSTRYIRTGFVK